MYNPNQVYPSYIQHPLYLSYPEPEAYPNSMPSRVVPMYTLIGYADPYCLLPSMQINYPFFPLQQPMQRYGENPIGRGRVKKSPTGQPHNRKVANVVQKTLALPEVVPQVKVSKRQEEAKGSKSETVCSNLLRVNNEPKRESYLDQGDLSHAESIYHLPTFIENPLADEYSKEEQPVGPVSDSVDEESSHDVKEPEMNGRASNRLPRLPRLPKLHRAVVKGDVDAVSKILRRFNLEDSLSFKSIYQRSFEGRSALSYAIQNRKIPIIETFFKSGFNFDFLISRTALGDACFYGYVDIANLLLEKGVNLKKAIFVKKCFPAPLDPNRKLMVPCKQVIKFLLKNRACLKLDPNFDEEMVFNFIKSQFYFIAQTNSHTPETQLEFESIQAMLQSKINKKKQQKLSKIRSL